MSYTESNELDGLKPEFMNNLQIMKGVQIGSDLLPWLTKPVSTHLFIVKSPCHKLFGVCAVLMDGPKKIAKAAAHLTSDEYDQLNRSINTALCKVVDNCMRLEVLEGVKHPKILKVGGYEGSRAYLIRKTINDYDSFIIAAICSKNDQGDVISIFRGNGKHSSYHAY